MRLSALLPMLAIAEMTCAQSPLIKGEISSRDSRSRLSMTKFENLSRAESGSGFAEIKVWNPSVSSTHILAESQHARKTQKFHAPMATRAMLPANIPPKINAMMVANNLESGTKRGFVSIDVSETPTYTVIGNVNINANYGSVYFDNSFFGVNRWWLGTDFYMINTTDFSFIESEYDGDFRAMAMCYEESTATIYGVFANYETETYYFGTFNPYTYATTQIKDWGGSLSFSGIAVNSKGEIYGVDDAGSLYKVDKKTGDYTLLKDFPEMANEHVVGAVIDQNTGLMYYTSHTESTADLWVIDTDALTASKVCALPDQMEIVGLWIPAPVNNAVPGLATDITGDFPDFSLTGMLRFKAPGTLLDGSAATGNMTYSVLVDGVEKATGSTTGGSDVTASLTVDEGGLHYFSVIFSNSAGKGGKASIQMFVGPDNPSRPSNFEYTLDGDSFTLTWEAPTECVMGSPIKPDGLTYDIYLYDKTHDVLTPLATDVTGTTYTCQVEEPEQINNYYFIIVAKYLGLTSGEQTTDTFSYGYILPPYILNFDTKDEFNQCLVLRGANGSGSNWMWSFENFWAMVQTGVMQGNDTYLVTPGIKYQKDKLYKIKFKAALEGAPSEWKPNNLSVYFGSEPTLEGLSTELLPATPVTSTEPEWQDFTVSFVPEETGVYYVAIRNTVPSWGGKMFVDNIDIREGVATILPTAVKELTAVADPDGALKATLTFTAPDMTISGESLTELKHIAVYRDGSLIGHVSPVTPGQVCTYTDETVTTHGEHLYSVIAYGPEGPGDDAETKVFVGRANASPVDGVHTTDISTNGLYNKKKIDWPQVTTDIMGHKIDPSEFTYTVTRNTYNGDGWDETVIADKTTETSLTDEFPVADEADQSIIYYSFITHSPYGDSEIAYSNNDWYGKPYGVPFKESAPNGEIEHYSMSYVLGNLYGNWETYTDEAFTDYKSSDSDNGFLGFHAYYPDDRLRLTQGYIQIPEDGVYMLCFDRALMPGSTNIINVSINERGNGNDFKTVASFPTDGNPGWKKSVVSLRDFAGKQIRFGLDVSYLSYSISLIDCIEIKELPERDIQNVAITMPEEVQAGDLVPMVISFDNIGRLSNDNSRVTILRNGETIATLKLPAVGSGQKGSVGFSDTTTALTPDGIVTYKAVVDYPGDLTAEESEPVAVSVYSSALPPVEIASGEISDDGLVQLNWEKPETTIHNPVTETFEDYAPWTTDKFGDWESVKLDNGLNVEFSDVAIPCLTGGQTRVPFFIFNSKECQSYNLMPFDGMQYAACIRNTDSEIPMNVMLFSPELSGEMQYVSFMARCIRTDFPETLKLGYTTGSTSADDFVKVATVTLAADAWTPVRVKLPKGAARFCLRVVSNPGVMFGLDNVSLATATAPTEILNLLGYNIYRDGVCITTTPHVAAPFNDAVTDGEHIYHITAVYDCGESMPSDAIRIVRTGIDVPMADKGETVYYNLQGIRVYRPTHGDILIKVEDGKSEKIYY